MLPIAVLISGTGRSLQNLIERQAAGQLPIEIRLVVSSRPDAAGLSFAKKASLRHVTVDRRAHDNAELFSQAVFHACREQQVELVVLAGFLSLLKIPPDYRQRVINIHPSLIPAFSGQGFYGERVHQAVLESGVRLTGCTVHYVDDEYDHGPVILQKRVPVLDDDSPETLAARVFAAECEALPEAIRQIAQHRTEPASGGPGPRT